MTLVQNWQTVADGNVRDYGFVRKFDMGTDEPIMYPPDSAVEYVVPPIQDQEWGPILRP